MRLRLKTLTPDDSVTTDIAGRKILISVVEGRRALTENDDGGHTRVWAPKAHPQSRRRARAVKVTDE